MKIVFMGTPDFAVPVLERLIDDGHEVGFVVTQPDRAGNRGKVIFSPVKQSALDHGIKVLQPDNISKDEEAISEITGFEPDVIIVVAYGQILRKNVIDIPKLGIYNVHASLLPKLRGASPIQHAILEGDERAGVTIMKVDVGLDTGDMLISDSVEIGRMNFEELHDALSEIGAELMSRALGLIESGEAVFTPQNDEESTYAGMISKQDGKIDFSEPAEVIDRKIRAFDPWPGAFCDMEGKTIKIWKAEPVTWLNDNNEESAGSESVGAASASAVTDSNKAPGTVISSDPSGIAVKCGEGVLIIKEIQMPGKKRTTVKDFLLGHKVDKGTVLS